MKKNRVKNAGLGFFAMVNSIPSQIRLHTAPESCCIAT